MNKINKGTYILVPIILKIVDHEYRILNVSAKFPRSTHEPDVWRMSAVRQHLCNTYRNS